MDMDITGGKRHTFFKKTANSLQPLSRTLRFPARLKLGNVPLTSKACSIGLRARSSSMMPFSSRTSLRAHSDESTSASASAAWRFRGVSRVFWERGGDEEEDEDWGSGRRVRWRTRGRGWRGRILESAQVKEREGEEYEVHL
jgi:hypothetical protein